MVTQKEKLSLYKAELHIHTVLSPCASVEMIPPLIIEEAKSKGINLIAITDHNSIDNIQSVIEAAEGTNLVVLPGIELQTREEIHSICLFDTLRQAHNFFQEIEHSFPNINNKSDYFGEQYIVDKTGIFLRKEERLLIFSSTLSLNDAIKIVRSAGGLLIPAHVNRKAYGLFPVLGFIPEDIDLNIFEISRNITPSEAIEIYPQLKDKYLIQNGDAHFLEDIIGYNQFLIKEPTVNEIQLALAGKNNRVYRNLNLISPLQSRASS